MEHLPDKPLITLLFPLVPLARNLDCSGCRIYLLSLCILLLFVFTRNYYVGIPECGMRYNAVVGVLMTHAMYNLLEFIGDGGSIPWKAMCTLYF